MYLVLSTFLYYYSTTQVNLFDDDLYSYFVTSPFISVSRPYSGVSLDHNCAALFKEGVVGGTSCHIPQWCGKRHHVELPGMSTFFTTGKVCYGDHFFTRTLLKVDGYGYNDPRTFSSTFQAERERSRLPVLISSYDEYHNSLPLLHTPVYRQLEGGKVELLSSACFDFGVRRDPDSGAGVYPDFHFPSSNRICYPDLYTSAGIGICRPITFDLSDYYQLSTSINVEWLRLSPGYLDFEMGKADMCSCPFCRCVNLTSLEHFNVRDGLDFDACLMVFGYDKCMTKLNTTYGVEKCEKIMLRDLDEGKSVVERTIDYVVSIFEGWARSLIKFLMNVVYEALLFVFGLILDMQLFVPLIVFVISYVRTTKLVLSLFIMAPFLYYVL